MYNICLPAVRLESPESKNIMIVKFTARYDFPHCPKMGAQTIWYPCLAENWEMSAHYKGNTWWSLPSAFRFPQSDGFHPDGLVIFVNCVLFSLIFQFIWFGFGYDSQKGFACCFPPPGVLFVNYPSPPDILSSLQLRIVFIRENAITAGNCLSEKILERNKITLFDDFTTVISHS